MSDYIALVAVRQSAHKALSALPHAPVVDDGLGTPAGPRPVRRSIAVTLRATAAVERRLADRLDPAPCGPVAAHG